MPAEFSSFPPPFFGLPFFVEDHGPPVIEMEDAESPEPIEEQGLDQTSIRRFSDIYCDKTEEIEVKERPRNQILLEKAANDGHSKDLKIKKKDLKRERPEEKDEDIEDRIEDIITRFREKLRLSFPEQADVEAAVEKTSSGEHIIPKDLLTDFMNAKAMNPDHPEVVILGHQLKWLNPAIFK